MEKKIVSAIGKLGFVVFLVIFPHFVPLPFYSYALVCFGAIFLMLRKEGKTFRDIGLIKGKFTSRAIILGVFTGLTWVAFMQFVYIPSIKYFFEVSDYTEYNFIKSNMTMLIMTVFAAIVIGGFYEEIVFRGYIQSVLEKRIFICFNPLISMLLTSLLFGIYHVQQDIFAVIAA
ncbi:MAG: lysostaphin resistance A-like protein, partial [Sphingobacterium sp.]